VRLRIAWAALVGLIAVAAGTARLALLGWLLAQVLARAPVTALAGPLALVALVIAARGALEHYRTMVAHETAARVQGRLRALLYDHVATLGPAHFTRSRTGDVIVSMVEGVQQLETYFGQYLPQLAVAVLTPLLIFTFVAFIDWPIALVMLVAALVTLLAPAAWHRHDSARSLARSRAYSAFASEFLDAIQGLATLKAFGQSAARARLLKEKSAALFASTMGVLASNTAGRGITDTGMAVGAAVALAWGASRVRAGEMPLGALLVILMLGVEVFRPLRELRVVLHQGMLGVSAAHGMFALLDAQPLVRDPSPAPRDPGPIAPTVAFERVTFAYPEASRGRGGARAPAHDGLSFRVAPGERVAFVGPSGAGKSTIARLLLRFYDPTEGCVRVGGHDARELPLERLRAQVAVVSQDTYLFHGTVEDNLRMGRPDATLEELAAAARAANAHAFITRLPRGYRTVVGERGVRLSGGQRQRIAIARALLRDAPILVLDEALSSVDAESEALIQEALDRLMRGRTTLIFAHRLSSVIGADRILAVESGRVVEEGTHAELMAQRGGLYHALMSMQAERGPDDVILDPDGAGVRAPDTPAASGEPRESDLTAEPTEGIVRAEGLGWLALMGILLGMVRGYRARLATTFVLGVSRVAALIGVGLVSSLVVRAVARGAPTATLLVALAVVAPLAGLLH
jgi:ABC-type multidrug transport system fused ATPase/permease subunit